MLHSAYTIYAGAVADPFCELRATSIEIANGCIASVHRAGEAVRRQEGDIDARDLLVVPGFIDIHVHGGGGFSLLDGTPDALISTAKHLARHGVTAFLPTSITAPWRETAALCRATRDMMRGSVAHTGAEALGVHLEGPYINPVRKGAQPAEHIRRPSFDDMRRSLGDLAGVARIMTLAPEMPGGIECCAALARAGVVPSIGHSAATYAEVCRATAVGARGFTHTFNAMTQPTGREPGVAGAALAGCGSYAELIWDNIHVHEASCRALIRARGIDGVVLISDGIQGAGMEDGYQFQLGTAMVTLQNGAARLPDGTLAGSVLTLDQAWRNASCCSLSDRARLTSWNAARALNAHSRRGRIAPGWIADLVMIDRNGEVVQTISHGRTVYRAADSL